MSAVYTYHPSYTLNNPGILKFVNTIPEFPNRKQLQRFLRKHNSPIRECDYNKIAIIDLLNLLHWVFNTASIFSINVDHICMFLEEYIYNMYLTGYESVILVTKVLLNPYFQEKQNTFISKVIKYFHTYEIRIFINFVQYKECLDNTRDRNGDDILSLLTLWTYVQECPNNVVLISNDKYDKSEDLEVFKKFARFGIKYIESYYNGLWFIK